MQRACRTIGAPALVVVSSPTAEPGSAQPVQPPEFPGALAGEWSVVSEAAFGPGQEPVRTEGREAALTVGGPWLVAESTGTAGSSGEEGR